MEIRPLVPQLVDDFLSLFDAAFSDNPYWMGCYCTYSSEPRAATISGKPVPTPPPLIAKRDANGSAPGNGRDCLPTTTSRSSGGATSAARDTFVDLRAYAEAVEPGDAPTRFGHVFRRPPRTPTSRRGDGATGARRRLLPRPRHGHRGGLLPSARRTPPIRPSRGPPRRTRGRGRCTSKPATASIASSTVSW